MFFPLTLRECQFVLSRMKMFFFLSLIPGCIKYSLQPYVLNGMLLMFSYMYIFTLEMSEKN